MVEWLIATVFHLGLCSALQSHAAVPIMAACAGETWHPHRGGCGCFFSFHPHHRFLLLSGAEERTSSDKPSRSENLSYKCRHTCISEIAWYFRKRYQSYLSLARHTKMFHHAPFGLIQTSKVSVKISLPYLFVQEECYQFYTSKTVYSPLLIWK